MKLIYVQYLLKLWFGTEFGKSSIYPLNMFVEETILFLILTFLNIKQNKKKKKTNKQNTNKTKQTNQQKAKQNKTKQNKKRNKQQN